MCWNEGVKNTCIVRELGNENIDVINYTNNLQLYITRALSPAKINSLKIKYNKVLGYHIEIRTNHLDKINLFNQFIHRQTTAQTVRYTTKELLDLDTFSNLIQNETKNFDNIAENLDINSNTFKFSFTLDDFARSFGDTYGIDINNYSDLTDFV